MAGQRYSSSEFQGFSVPAAAAAVRAWAGSATQQFSVSAFERCCCPAGGAWAASAPPQQFSVSEFKRLSVAAAAAAGRGWAALQQFRVSGLQRCRCPGVSACPASASQQFSVSAVKRSGCGGGGAWQGSVTAVQSFRASAFPLRRPRCVPGQRQRRSSSVFQGLSVAVALVSVPAQR